MKQTNNFTRRTAAMPAVLIMIFMCGAAAFAQTTAFTYQGKLSDGAVAASGTYDLGFALYDAETGGTQIGTALTRSNVTVSGGIFTVSLDFGANPFTSGANRFLEIAVKKTTETSFTTLTPRQPLTSSPYSIRTLSATAADALSTACVGCVTNAQINSVAGTKVTGTVANATTATNATTANTATIAGNVSGVVAIANGGTGSATQNFVDTTTAQTVAGNKNLTGLTTLGGGARLPSSGGDPEAASANNLGRVYFNTTINSLRLSDGGSWITAGQPAIYHIYGTAGRLGVATSAATVQPGMSRTITVPAGFTASVVVNASIGGRNTQSTANLYATVDMIIYVDGNFLARGGWNRFSIVNPGVTSNSFTNSAINTAVSVGAGNHTFELRTARLNGTTSVDIGGNAITDINPGEMTLTVYYTPVTFVNRPTEGGEIISPETDRRDGGDSRRKIVTEPKPPK